MSRDVNANGGRDHYPWRAHDRAFERARRPKEAKLACARLAQQMTDWLEEWWFPEEVAAALERENTNGLLRQYMPKGADLWLVTEAELRHRPESQQPSS